MQLIYLKYGVISGKVKENINQAILSHILKISTKKENITWIMEKSGLWLKS